MGKSSKTEIYSETLKQIKEQWSNCFLPEETEIVFYENVSGYSWSDTLLIVKINTYLYSIVGDDTWEPILISAEEAINLITEFNQSNNIYR